jgi:hypothetical protein
MYWTPISYRLSQEQPSGNTGPPKRKITKGPWGGSQVPQANPPAIRLHNSDKERDREKATDHMRVKIYKNRHKTEEQLYEYNCTHGKTENSHNMIFT